ncbi:hypothetical protein ACHAXA_008971 [Cyclostephanos tholiformis]|uniref:NECAP PHear domain-containing protein n=1 Tax=Cyclostephanos tholiformis TaxID=382380 RepID=A0ABD3SBM3_9STRA
MLKRAAARSNPSPTTFVTPTPPSSRPSIFHAADPNSPPPPANEVIERVRLRVPNAHVFKLPPKPSSGGWRGAEWRDKVWQGTLKVVERGDETAVLLVDPNDERNTFAVCPIRHDLGGMDGGTNAGNGVDRCVDSSRYFVLRIQNAAGRHMYIGLAFNERNDAFDFNTSLEDSRREKIMERRAEAARGEMERLGTDQTVGGGMSYKMKDGEKMRVSIPKTSGMGGNDDDEGERRKRQQSTSAAATTKERKEVGKESIKKSGGGLLLKPSSKDTPSRLA